MFTAFDCDRYYREPVRMTEGSAGWDLCSSENTKLIYNTTQIIETNTQVFIPKGYVGLICSRSGLAAKDNIFVLNAPGIVDSDYEGELKVILRNGDNNRSLVIKKGDRIAQLVIVPCFMSESEEPTVLRGTGGFGSTGIDDNVVPLRSRYAR